MFSSKEIQTAPSKLGFCMARNQGESRSEIMVGTEWLGCKESCVYTGPSSEQKAQLKSALAAAFFGYVYISTYVHQGCEKTPP